MLNTVYTNIRIHIEGLVQGIGFRPHVYRTAGLRNVHGTVENTGNGVVIHAMGTPENLRCFIEDLQHRQVPPAAVIREVKTRPEVKTLYKGFRIVESRPEKDAITRISPDLAVCEDCLKDMRKQNGRKNYPFINCTNCGPRFSIIRGIPYDRERTTMSDFIMCDECRSEYTDIHNRRFHAQPIACTRCGPTYYIQNKSVEIRNIDNIISYTAEMIDSGCIIALMGLGGFHLACDGRNPTAVTSLRQRKHRESKPFALMMPDLKTVRNFALLHRTEEELLSSVQRPAVLLKQIPGTLPDEINNGLDSIGVMLPYMPFHHLLFEKIRTDVLVMSSGNRSSEPIVISHDDALVKFHGIADCIVSHNRRIHNRVDDSVAFVTGKKVHIIRRSRGWVPDPIITELPVDGLAAFGGELKNTFALGRKSHIVLSQHIGDLNNSETMNFLEESFSRFKKLFRIEPEMFIHDMHPDYLSTHFARKTAEKIGCPALGIQHHEAHIASVIVEHALKDPVIGLCYDGAGYGKDGTIWGGEVFSGSLKGFRREVHLSPVMLPGGDAASGETWRSALSYLFHAYGEDFRSLPLELLTWIKATGGPERLGQILFMMNNAINSPLSSGMGRLFDSIAALLGICFRNRYEGEAPMLLESTAERSEKGSYNYEISDEIIDVRRIIRGVVQDILENTPKEIIAGRFMNTVVRFSCDAADRVRMRTGIRKTALSGGVFQNRFILEHCEREMRRRGYTVYSNSLIPANDGGLPPGQMGMAAVKRG